MSYFTDKETASAFTMADWNSTRSVNIPFDGFYNSRWSEALDNEEEQWAEYEGEYREEENGIPPELRLTASEYGELAFKHSNHSAAYERVAKWYAEAFDGAVSDLIGFKLKMKFEAMTSPREYNFSTDRIFCDIPYSSVVKMFRLHLKDSLQTLGKTICERHTSYDGFHSWYDNEITDWLEKPLADWDHNELGTLLVATLALFLKTRGDKEDFESAVEDSILSDSGAYDAWSDCVNWKALEAEIEEMREEKAEEIRCDDPDYVPPAPRCLHTIDMFGGAA